ncbi:DUF4238 domain-containing protein [Aliarcobacter butzleri]|uniref:DUF4238 domain-containing protein n=1 Tax=Aliarcobacter butzleri TaxID=28197 RepID=UPI0021B6E0F8|nr:DUF4238 domain-containing protein [Aliarcobacter butzleri]MCT7643862.1 DUF4238 domain-containing protein [Aliarcobacter butzleri]
MIKKRQHYVSRYYLKAWTNQKEQINCLREQKNFKSNLMGVAQENLFYELQNLNDIEIKFIKSIINLSPFEKLRKFNINWLENYTIIHNIEKKYKVFINKNNTLKEEINIFKKNFEEDCHSNIEKIGYKYLDFVRNKNIDFYYDKNSSDRLKFLHYLCVQYFRTNNIKQRVIKGFKDESIDMSKIYPVTANIFATNLSYNLHMDKTMNLFLLINNTNLEFITGDQPVLNTYGVYKDGELKDDEFELYYPISPKLAVLISDKNINNKVINISDENKINEYNKFIVHSSYEQIFATNEETLLLYKDEVKKEIQ